MKNLIFLLLFAIGFTVGNAQAANSKKASERAEKPQKRSRTLRMPDVEYGKNGALVRKLLPKLAQEKLLRYEAKLLTPKSERTKK